jgi:hypothetical protein
LNLSFFSYKVAKKKYKKGGERRGGIWPTMPSHAQPCCEGVTVGEKIRNKQARTQRRATKKPGHAGAGAGREYSPATGGFYTLTKIRHLRETVFVTAVFS